MRTKSLGLAALALAALVSVAHAEEQAWTIVSASVSADGKVLAIDGRNFRTPATVKLNDVALVIQSATATHIVATMPQPPLVAGTYLLSVAPAQGHDDRRAAATFDLTIGAVGPPGPKGADGQNGVNGADGAKGDKGDTGPAGPGGVRGFAEFVQPGDYQFIVPPDVTHILVEAWGGSGGGGSADSVCGGGGGGAGGYVRAAVPVQPGQTLGIHVGGGGLPAQDGADTRIFSASDSISAGHGRAGSNADCWNTPIDQAPAAGGAGGAGFYGLNANSFMVRSGFRGGDGTFSRPGMGGRMWFGSIEPRVSDNGSGGSVPNGSGRYGAAGYMFISW